MSAGGDCIDSESSPLLGNEGLEAPKDPSTDPLTGVLEPNYKVGLSQAEVEVQLEKYGKNAIEVYVEPWYLLLLHQFLQPMSIILEVSMAIAGSGEEWGDFSIIGTMLCVNSFLGFAEEMKARASVDSLKKKTVSQVTVVRGGETFNIDPDELVPQDIVYLRAGDGLPADVVYLLGPEMKINTAAVTGESLPRRYGKDIFYCEEGCEPVEGQQKYDRYIAQGCTVQEGAGSYCVVKRTGSKTTQGAAIGSMETSSTQSAFEKRIILITMWIIIATLVDVLVVISVQVFVRGYSLSKVITDCLSIIIASVPVALPMVIQITMSLGSLHMSEDHGAVVTSLPALQDIAGMEVLCSDKTGTLTTAEFEAYPDKIWVNPALADRLTCDDVLTYAAVACGPSGEDVIDKSIFKAVTERFGKLTEEEVDGITRELVEAMHTKEGRTPTTDEIEQEIKLRRVRKAKESSAGLYEVKNEEDVMAFSPSLKRFVVKATKNPEGEEIIFAKGIVNKMVANGGEPGAVELNTWTVVSADKLGDQVGEVDKALALESFKTIGVAFAKKGSKGEWVWQFAGIIPMKDPPRHDTPEVIRELKDELGVSVKMVTGDHLNIARTTAFDIGMKNSIDEVDIYPTSELQQMYTEATTTRGSTKFNFTEEGERKVHNADGFAQVLPKDKAAVIAAFKSPKTYEPMIVGMTGDGVNDAVALKNSHVGIAVHDATPAAKQAADMILTREGLSPILAAVRESRCIYARLRSYVLYRIGATIQIVLVLSTLVFAYDVVMPAFYVILLALLNDITMLTVSYDNATPSPKPEKPTVFGIIMLSGVIGVLMAASSIGFYAIAKATSGDLFSASFSYSSEYVYSCMYLQISIGIETMIFSCRNPFDWFFMGKPACWLLIGSVVFANALVITMCYCGWVVKILSLGDIGMIIVYDVAVFLLVDAAKVGTAQLLAAGYADFIAESAIYDSNASTKVDSEGAGSESEPEQNFTMQEESNAEGGSGIGGGGGPSVATTDADASDSEEEKLRSLDFLRPDDSLTALFKFARGTAPECGRFRRRSGGAGAARGRDEWVQAAF